MVVSTPFAPDSSLDRADERIDRILLPTVGTVSNRHAAEIAFTIAAAETALVEIVHDFLNLVLEILSLLLLAAFPFLMIYFTNSMLWLIVLNSVLCALIIGSVLWFSFASFRRFAELMRRAARAVNDQ